MKKKTLFFLLAVLLLMPVLTPLNTIVSADEPTIDETDETVEKVAEVETKESSIEPSEETVVDMTVTLTA